MALTSVRGVSCKSVVAAPAARRTRVVQISAMKQGSKPSAAFAAAAAAALLVASPVIAVPELITLNPVSDVAAGPGTKVKQAAKDISGKGALAPDVEGQIRSGGAGKPRAAALQKKTFVAASKEDQQSAIDKYPESAVRWRR